MDPGRYSFPRQPKANPKAVVRGDSGSKYRFTVLTDRLLRYEWSEDGGFEDRASTFAFFRYFEHVPAFRVVDDKDRLEIVTAHFHLVYSKRDFSPETLTVTVGTETWRYDGQSYGDLGGTCRTLDGADGRVRLDPGVVSRKPYAVLDDSGSMLFGDDGFIASRLPQRRDGYVFAHNGAHKDAIKDFYRVSGKQPLLPRWALGNWWSRYHEYSSDEYLGLMDRFRDEGIPMNVGVLDMDWHRVDDVPEKYGSGWTGYTWNKKLFPDPEGFLRALHDRKLKVTVNDHPADGVRAFEDLYETVARALHVDTSHGDPIKFDVTDRKFLDAYFDVLKYRLEQQGIDFWWVDWQQGNKTKIPGIDPLWVLNHYHYLSSARQLASLGQPIGFSRYAGPGSHRYPVGFSGDVQVTWASLRFQPEFTATASNVGFGWWSHDIGGHMFGARDADLTARWFQLGLFSPVLRLHSTKNEWNSKEPWLWEPPAAAAAMRDALRLRHRLIPFLFTMNVRAHTRDEPLVQPMYWMHPADEDAYQVPNEYYFGPDLIVAPITAPLSPATRLGAVRVWLPPGPRRYVDLFHPGLVYDGGRHVVVNRPLSEVPVFAREGTMVPLDASETLENGAPVPASMLVALVVGADAAFELVEEDEALEPGLRAQVASFVRTPIVWHQKTGRLRIGPATQDGSASSTTTGRTRTWSVKLIGVDSEGQRPTLPRGTTMLASEPHTTVISLGAVSAAQRADFDLGADLQLDVVDMGARLREMLFRCEIPYDQKEEVWALVAEDSRPVHVRIPRLYELGLDAQVRDAVLEVWFADARAERRGGGLFTCDASMSDGEIVSTRETMEME
ncbi:hypothetical protein P8C59_005808 [Phyllachora maydis]|uniref:alpha-glucosidase n=1 Tax=Phyllachora maydis TaxID=1825666 RepID=A0AAD9I659_9PEZI|nr:hypothetical protein P8C59_005808 [Phyllachora maydis]